MSKTSIEIDRDIADQVAEILGTSTLRDTVHASLLEIVNAKKAFGIDRVTERTRAFRLCRCYWCLGWRQLVGRATFLADTSVFSRLAKPAVAAAAAPLFAVGRVAICDPVIFELGYTARNKADYELIIARLATFDSIPVTSGDILRAV